MNLHLSSANMANLMAQIGPFTVFDALVLCGVDNMTFYQQETPAARLAEGLFSNSFMKCMDKTMKDLKEDFEAYSTLTVAQGQIRLTPTVKNKIKAFIQWTRNQVRMGIDPGTLPFPVAESALLERQLATHELYVKQAKDATDTLKPKPFKGEVKWVDWKPTLVNFLHQLPGRDGVPLSYVVRDNDAADPMHRTNFLDMYVYNAPLNGEAYDLDSARVANVIQSLILGNTQAEAKIQTLATAADGRAMFKALNEHYLGVGAFAMEVTAAEKVIDTLYYNGERKPHMWWMEFERQLRLAYATIDKAEGREVYSDVQKLRHLIQKVKADFLSHQMVAISMKVSERNMIFTFDQALESIRDAVNLKHPPSMTDTTTTRPSRHVREANTARGRHGGRGRGGRGRGNSSNNRREHNLRNDTYKNKHDVHKQRNDSEILKLNNGKWFEYHPSFSFATELYQEFPADLKAKLKTQREEHRNNRRGQNNPSTTSTVDSFRQIQALQSQLDTLRGSITLPPPPPPPTIYTDNQTQVSQVSFATNNNPSIMGGRNDQSARHQPRNINMLYSTRCTISMASAHVKPSAASPPHTSADNELDSNADTTVMGTNFALLSLSRRVADVYAFDPSLPSKEIPIATGATIFDHPGGFPILLVVHEALWFGSQLDHSLLNPNQVRSYGIPLWDNPFDDTRPLGMDLSHNITLPFETRGTKILFHSRVPTTRELQDPNILRFEITSPHDWNPSTVSLSPIHVATTKSTPIPQGPTWTSHDSDTGCRCYYDPGADDAILHDADPTLLSIPHGIDLTRTINQLAINDRPTRHTFVSNDRHQRATAELLSETFGIGIDRARKTLLATLQKGTRSAILPLERRYHADRRFEARRLKGKFSTDTAYFPCKSLRGNIASQIYFEKCGFTACYHIPRATNEHVGPTLSAFSSEFGIPEHLTMDGAQVQVGRHTTFQTFIRRHNIDFHVSHPRRPNENPAEGGIREVKRRFYRFIQKYDIPMRLWDFVLDYTVSVINITVNSSRYAQDRTPLEIITGITPDISEFMDFHIYSWVFYKMNAGLGPRQLGRWLGVSHRRGPMMTYWILTNHGDIISCDSVQRVTNLEQDTNEIRTAMAQYTSDVTPRLQAAAGNIQLPEHPHDMLFDLDNEDDDFLRDYNRVLENNAPLLEGPAADNQEMEPDTYIDMEIGLRRDPEAPLQRAKVKRRKTDDSGTPIGQSHPTGNPLLDQRLYEVEFLDGTQETLAANLLAESILAQVDEDGHRQLLIDEIIDHRRLADAIPIDKGLITTRTGTTRKVQTTRGWELYVQWKDGSTTWVPLSEMKQSFPIETAQYARDHELLKEPAFDWWARHVLKKSLTVLSKIKSKYWERTHKYGIRIPKTVKEAIAIDKENGDTQWMDAIRKEMGAIRTALEQFDGDTRSLVGYQLITGHLIFDVKLGENFRRKARFCADGHKTQAPSSITYSSVVSRDSVRIMLLIAALNGLTIKAADIENAFLTAPNLEKVYIRAGPEFGPDEGKTFIIRKALYGLKSASAAFRAYLAEKLEEIGFRSTTADPDVWLRAAVDVDGTEYYSYVLAYVDDILAIDKDPDAIMKQIGERFKFKNNAVEEPENYLGAKLQKRKLEDTEMWTMSSSTYTDAALKNLDNQLKGTRWTIPKSAPTPLPSDYHPELDDTELLDDEDRTLFQELIGIIRWATEIGRVDVLYEVSVLSQYQAQPREGHLQNLLRIFAYWKSSPKISLYFDPRLPRHDYTTFTTRHEDFEVHYRDAKDELPHNMPPPRGRPVIITAFVDASHAANQQTRRSHSGYVIFVNRAPILWYSKRQNTVEASTFSSEFIALKACTEAIVHLRFKLRMFGIPLCHEPASEEHPDGKTLPAYVYCDNQSVVKNSTLIESTLNKKHSSLAYHYVRWHVAARIVSLSWISTHDNIADTFTKSLARVTREYLYGNWVY
jgi:hypothetical protein